MTYNTRNPAVKRLFKEAQELHEPTELYHAQPLEDNLFEWHFTIRGPEDTDFSGGIYHGRILLPSEYPMKPPNIVLLTPNGRFETHRKICLSISGYHPESWRPSWSIRTALLAIIGFMPTHGVGAIGSMDLPSEERRALARKSNSFVCDSCGCIRNLLRPLTDASKAVSQEATATASQISMTGDGDGQNNHSDKKPTCAPSTSVSATPENTLTAPISSAVLEATQSVSFVSSVSAIGSISAPTSGNSVPIAPSIAPTFDTCPILKWPTEVVYWMCYPVYYQPLFFDPRQNVGTGTGINVTSPITSTTSLTTMPLSAGGERKPLGFVDWLKQTREKRAAGLACEQPPSPDPTSAPLTRAVVSNSATWLSHCASASFGVHRSPADSRATAEMTAIPSIMGEEASLIARDDECVARPHSEIILTSGSTNDTVIAGVTESNRNKTHISPLNVCDASDLTGVIPVDGQFDTSVQLPMHAEKIKNNSLIEDTNVSDDVVHIKDSNYQGVLDSHTKVLESSTGLNVALTAKPSDVSSEPIKSSTAQGALVTTTSHGAFQAVQNEVEEPPSVLCRCTAFNETCGNGLIDRSGSTDPELRRPASGLLQPPAAASAVSLQYRAATVCAASVAVALILVVMRRLSLMLHGA